MSAVIEYRKGEDRAGAGAQGRPWDVSQYRERARTLRELALRTRFPEVQRELEALALRHERLAAYVETRFRDEAEARAHLDAVD
jgi:hypothetical protein